MRERRKRKNGAAAVILVVVLVAAGVLLWGRGTQKNREKSADQTGPAQTEATPAPTPEPPPPTPTPTPWNLVLVNRDHPVPEDWTVDPVALPNGQTVDARIYGPLMEMFEAARDVNMDLLPNVESGYRSVERQRELYDQKKAEFLQQGYSEAEAVRQTEQWVTRPGTSEHQLGLAVDISGAVYDIYPWLQEHSWEYGFILRYPPDKTAITGVAHEEWHYRYVGREAAAEIRELGLCLEEYTEQLKQRQ